MGRNILRILLLLCCVLRSHVGQLIRDSRCFLETGATSVHLFASEDLPVGGTVGVLGVVGDPSAQGDIVLSLQELDSPVAFLPYTKNLTLVKPLDKEGINGPASVIVNVICDKRHHTLDPGFIIPVNIRVTDANDNSPQFINTPYVLNISEVTVVGTRVLQGVRAVDADQPGPYSTVQYTILPGAHSDYFVFVSAIEGTLVLRKSLDYETLSNFSVGIRAQDQGNPPRSSTTTLYVNVIDADDQNPAFLNDQYKVTVPHHVKGRRTLRVVPDAIKAVDQDRGINAPVRYTIQNRILPFLDLNVDTAEIVMVRSLQDHELLTSATMVIKATQVDNSDRYALATVVVSREDSYGADPTVGGRVPVKFLLREHHTSVPENTKPESVLLTMRVNKPDPNLRFWLSTEAERRFSITNAGQLILKGNLDYEKWIQHSFRVHVTDGYNNDTAHVNILVEDVNDWEPRFSHSSYEFHVHSAREGSVIGQVAAFDADRDDNVTLSLRGRDARFFEIKDNGELVLKSLGLFNGSSARFMVIASDNGKPPKSRMVPVTVYLPNNGLIAARAAPAWLGNSVLLVAIFGAVLGLLGVVILILILYIYKHKRPKSGGSVSSVGTGYCEKSPVPSALSPTPQVLGASVLQDTLEGPRNRRHDNDGNENDNSESRNDIDNPVFGETNDISYGATIKSIASARQLPLYARHKVAPAPNPPALSATSNIPNIGGLVQNMNDLSARTNLDAGSHDSSNYSGEPPDSLAPAWPASSALPRVKKLSWDDDDRTVDSVEVAAETRTGDSQPGNERLNLTVYF